MPTTKTENTLILLLGGSGSRFGGEVPKQFQATFGLPTDLPLFAFTAKKILSFVPCELLILAVKADYKDHAFFTRPLEKLQTSFPETSFLVTEGGRNRHESFLQAWKVLTETPKIDISKTRLLVHDANRPFLSDNFLLRLKERMENLSHQSPCFIPTIETADALVQVDKYGNLQRYFDRKFIKRVQTPQLIFAPALISQLSEKRSTKIKPQVLVSPKFFPDEGSMLLSFGLRCISFPGDAGNVKITFPEDLSLLKNL